MESIEVGEYIRTKDGYIAKVIKKDKEGWYHCDSTVEECYEDDFKFFKKGELDIVKHSPNTEELIEENDYVNGCVVLEKPYEHFGKILIGLDTQQACGWGEGQMPIEHIKTIVTKEQFERIMYKVGD